MAEKHYFLLRGDFGRAKPELYPVPYDYLDIASTPGVRAAQEASGSGEFWANFEGDRPSAGLLPVRTRNFKLLAFLAAQPNHVFLDPKSLSRPRITSSPLCDDRDLDKTQPNQ